MITFTDLNSGWNKVRPEGLQPEFGQGYEGNRKGGGQWQLAGQVFLHLQRLCAFHIAYKTP